MQGEIVFDAGGQRFTLFLGNAAQCAVEEHFDRGFFAVVTDAMPSMDPQTAMAIARSMSDGTELSPEQEGKVVGALRTLRVSLMRDLAWFGMRKHHPTIELADVSDIIDAIGQAAFGDILGRALRAAQGGDSGGDAAPGKPGARKPAARKPATRPRARTGGS